MTDQTNSGIYSGATPAEIAVDLLELVNFQEQGLPMETVTRLVQERLVPHLVRYNLPEFHSLYNFLPEKGALLGGAVALRYNQGVTNWQVSPGGVMLEEMCVQALCQLFGFPPESDATFMYCGTYANQQALYMALHRYAQQQGFDLAEQGVQGFQEPKRLAIVVSQDAHFSLKHGARILGLGERSLITVPVDADRCLDVEAFRAMLPGLRKERDIFCVVTTAGTTSTGSIDPILPLIEICSELGAWLHVDGAYGFAFSLLPELEERFAGIEQADSVTWDPHKQFGVPIPSSLLFAKHGVEFERMAIYGEYFNRRDDTEPNPGLKSPPSTRPLAALPLVTTLRFLGMQKIRERLRSPLRAIQALSERLRDEPDIELCHTPHTGILCLRIMPEGLPEEELDALQLYVYERIKREAKRSISLTRLGNQAVLRLLALSPAVTEQSMLETIDHARDLAKEFGTTAA
ncbi:MAG: pyridoxal-dependent decarboxylase [Candidatus Aminicenantaceae bacterium]|jgi:L-2,4-diaminobutyrate decarboxylase